MIIEQEYNTLENEPDEETWMFDIPESEEGASIVNYDVTSSPNDFNVSTLISFIEKGSIIIPRYQRNYVWDKKRASKLIESLILGLPIPQLFLYQEGRNKFSILDGQQRLLTIYFFYRMRFPKPGKRSILREKYGEFNNFEANLLGQNEYFSEFSLFFGRNIDGQNNPLQGAKYDTLGDHQTTLDLRTVRCVIIKQNEPEEEDNSSVFEIFDRLNTGGVNLKPQQIRSNIYHGKFYDELHELNKIEGWRKLIKRPSRDDNSRDEELILRILAMMFYGPSGYKPSMTQFLNKFSNNMKLMEKHGNLDQVSFVSSFFTEFLSIISSDHIEHFFSEGRFSIGTAESVFYAATKEAWDQKDISKIKNFSPEDVHAISDGIREFLIKGSAQSDNVKGRLEFALEIIK